MKEGKQFLSNLKLYSDYFKWLEDKNRYETWEDACVDIINGHKTKYQNDELNIFLESPRIFNC